MKTVPINSKTRRRRGAIYPGQFTGVFADIENNQSIRLHGVYNGRTPVEISFKVGNTAEYDSFNLHYLGTITKITDKCVTIDPKFGERQRRLDLNEFMWRNHNFNLEEMTERNRETSMYI